MSERSLNGGCAILIVKVRLDCLGANDRYFYAVALAFLVAAAFGLHHWAHERGTPTGADLAILLLGGGALVGLMILLGRYAAKHSD